MKKKFRRRQRGVVLLVVLSLLTLFTLLMVTFIIVSGQYRQSALSAARVSRVEPSPTKLLDNATFTLLRDSNDPKNPIRFHSLLFDMYGGDGFVGEIASNGVGNVGYFASASDGTGGNFFDLRIKVQAPNPLPPATPTTAGEPLDLAGTYHPLSFVDGYYNGCLLTVVSSSVARGRKFRVVDYQAPPSGAFPNPSQHVFRVMPIATSTENSSARPVAGDRVVLNGRPFNGTGFGYDSSTSTTDPKLNPSYALQPNQRLQSNTTQLANFVSGDADESYDAVDFQNMALAGIIPTNTVIAPSGLAVIPSFHRPSLVNYWYSTTVANVPGAVMRPMPWDHPNFTGGNTELTFGFDGAPGQRGVDDDGNGFTDRLPNGTWDAAEFGLPGTDDVDALRGLRANGSGGFIYVNPWDVDNDGDRIPDSIWVDLGFPTQTMPDGKQVRPLFAFLCTDLDGRINLNTAGSAGHITGYLGKTATTTLARGVSSSSLTAGAGLGPAEINPGYSTTSSYPLFQNANNSDQYATMLFSRYGTNQRPGVTGRDTFAAVKLFEFPTNYFGSTTATAYNSPPDLFGEFAVGLDHRGQPTYETPQVGRTDMVSNSPYEFDVTSQLRGRADIPFGVAELERILRYNEAESGQVPSRLTNLGGIVNTLYGVTAANMSSEIASRRRSVTTESYDVPAPPVLSLPELRNGFESTTNWQTQFPSFNSGRPLHVTDLLAARLSAGGVAQADINTEIAKMLSWDLRAGTRMDVNRPFGNGQDDNGNGVVDEHGPTSADQLEADPSVAEKIWSTTTFFDHDNDGNTTTDTNAYLARYHFAKHLYVLITTLKTSGQDIAFDGNGPTPADETARGLAQWAVNVVDFRDADSIMTAFEYDSNPFDGWDVDGSIATDDSTFGSDGLDNDGDGAVDEPDEIARAARASTQRFIVWGCERPELLITETLAFHDRRTEDLDTPSKKTTDDDGMGNIGEKTGGVLKVPNDFDQRLRPQGYTYVELYNPWNSKAGDNAVEHVPAEFYGTGAGPAEQGVLLNRVSGGATASPVWRLAVTAPAGGGAVIDPDDPTLTTPLAIERVVYFAPGGVTPGGAVLYSVPTTVGIARVLPGRNAVVGTYHLTQDEVNPVDGNTDGVNEFVSLIGRRNDLSISLADTTTTRRIAMHAGTNPLENWFHVFDDNQTPSWMPPSTVTPASSSYVADMQAPVTIPVFGFNISEIPAPAADSNLEAYGTTFHPETGEKIYTLPYDTPFDDARFPADTTRPNEKAIHLQRLANPLLPYNSITNPYRTIDGMNVDLTVFNGMASTSGPSIPKDNANTKFSSRERGVAGSTPARNLWSQTNTPPRATGAGAIASHYFNEDFLQSLGALNTSFGTRFIKNYADSTQTTAPADEFVGAPNSSSGFGHPFSWLTWNNRPYVSQHEMMLVPHSRSSKLLQDYSMVDTTGALPTVYDATTGTRQFGHLLNFFETTYFDPAGMSPPTPGSNLYRLFDYTHVPSPFMGTETWLDTNTFASGNGTALLHPPFDRVFSFREPGKVNINTIFEQRVWDAVRGQNNALTNFTFSSLVDSRRGYGTAGGNAVLLDSTVPTFFGNPFRAAEAGALVPLDSMKRAGVEASLLRSPAVSPNGASSTQVQSDAFFADASSPISSPAAAIHTEPNRNPYFRYQQMQRLSNLVTTRSNVYAIWVTMGMFEVTVENNGNGVFVERLGQEAGRETGSVKRHRAFYIVDRSIPVAFQPGENHNVEDAILLRRIIE